MIASSLAYGRVTQILRSVHAVLDCMGPHPARYLSDAGTQKIRRDFKGFRHRFNDGRDLADLLIGIKNALETGSLQAIFSAGVHAGGTVDAGLSALVDELVRPTGRRSFLLADPKSGSACKRLHLLLRWLVRSDRVDIGLWDAVAPADLTVPLDTHMHAFAKRLGLTGRKSAGSATAAEVTDAYRQICPHDPVRYDFALTRLGMRGDCHAAEFLTAWPREAVACA